MQAGCLRYKSLAMTINIKHWLGLSMFVIVLDQLTKLWIVSVFQFGDSLPLTSFFNLVHARNSGAAFSFLAGEGGWQRFFFIGIALAASFLVVLFVREQ